MTGDWRSQDARRAILRLCHSGLDPATFRTRVAQQLRRAIAFDAWCWPTADPATGLMTGLAGAGLPLGRSQRFCEIEYLEPDFNKFSDLARRRVPATYCVPIWRQPPRSRSPGATRSRAVENRTRNGWATPPQIAVNGTTLYAEVRGTGPASS